ncbi:uncharacterized protein BN604_02013 [Bacteroides intestinalis CAG:315]|jgi:tetratricopeptide (TPR) repeat protein|uniref:Tetratricopeptide repeat protein n=1 Tax=Bacteroides intestinalis TaxID=329854 RepID=A0A412YBJ4_9BACE|nr:tetratricopeptide repeat protein [Bacteroides intestinalis]RGV54765.1 tetratricopeptide repeat protein [Bacteroides intestinalis]RHA62779.1 tetratricopeptide repeat protein [Bacteroides intestinalis]CDD94528.1 uncharacterized protein BN604_02013 [Bacteroides intestinalis CAG:315]
MKKLLFFFLSITIFVFSSCKREVDAINPALLLIDSLMQSRPDSSLYLLEQFSDLQKIKNADKAFYNLLLTQARYKNYVLQNDSSIQIAIDYYKNNIDKEKLAKSYFYLGCIYLEQKKLPTAIDFYLKAVDVMPKGRDSIFSSMIYSHLGDCYSEQDLNKTALSMYKKAHTLCVGWDSLRTCYNLKNIGNAFLLERQWDSAYYYYQQALPIAFSLNNSGLLSAIYKNMATLYNEQNKFVDADACISRALGYLSEGESYMAACSIKGDIMDNMNKKDSAVHYWTIGAGSSNAYVKTSSYHSLFLESKRMEDWESSTLYADSFITFYDSIQIMNDRAEIDRLMDNHLVELHRYKLTAKNQRVVGSLVIVFLSLVFILIMLYFWRDRLRQKKYVSLQQQLMENRTETMLLHEESDDMTKDRNIELYKLEEERFAICMSLFRATNGYKKLCELKESTPKARILIVTNYRLKIISDIRRTFVDVMTDFKERCTTLTNDDLLYCILVLLDTPKEVIWDVMSSTPDAMKTRKSRIKNKMDTKLFEHIFGC